jgi:hypothetical protein
VLADPLWNVVGPVSPGDFRRDGPPGSSHWLRTHHRWNVVMRLVPSAAPVARLPGLSGRWHAWYWRWFRNARVSATDDACA